MGVFEIYPLKSEAQLVFLTQHAQARGNNISESGNILPNKVKENDFHWSLQKANARDWRWDDFSFMQKITNKLWSISMQEIEGIQTISLQPLPPTIIHHALLFWYMWSWLGVLVKLIYKIKTRHLILTCREKLFVSFINYTYNVRKGIELKYGKSWSSFSKKKKNISTCIGFDNLLERLCTSDQWFYWTCRYDNQSF